MDLDKHDITLLRSTVEDEDGNPVTTYGLSCNLKGRNIAIRDLSTKRSDVEIFISNLINGGGSLSLLDDLLEDFVS